ncbi:hypothetical protein C8T65DRAFT_693077 [Cerioporus squamosus]|nr:hypothetical protein C8T65DRAFT_693077 [Cerioporus squamosus]
MPKNSCNIVARPIKRGAGVASKTVLGTMGELNYHAPLLTYIRWQAEIAPHLIYEDPKPWKQPSRSIPRRGHSVRRNAGRNDGRTWVSRQFVCEDEDADWDLDLEDETEVLGSDYVSGSDEGRRSSERIEVGILDIAKPAKLRGVAREYAMVQSVSRVIAFPEDDRWVVVDEPAEAGWESVELEMSPKVRSRETYATILRT